ncbi:Alpha/beta hydrolase fold-1 [Xylariomycetidae sp. FL2044]|nr:Alpha/beta hydrolase fold-1 [Xylariomycetidae sp. FL2044]
MASAKPTVFIVHGGWHTPASYDKLATALGLAGYDFHVPHLSSMNAMKHPDGDLLSDTAQVRSCAEDLVHAGRTVVALLHSYGGQFGTNALHGLSSRGRARQALAGGVSHLVYMCAFILPEGWSTLNQAQARGIESANALPLKLAFDSQGGACTISAPREQLINPVSDEALVATYVSTLVPWNTRCMNQPLVHCVWRDIPVMYIHTTDDKVVKWESQKMMLERVKEHYLHDLLVVTLDTDHCPHLSATERVIEAVERVVMEIVD